MEYLTSPALVAFLITFTLIPALAPMAHRIGLTDKPGGRKQHADITPMHGGIAMFIGFSFACFFEEGLFDYAWPLLLISFFILVLGIIDDLKNISAKFRLFLQMSLALILTLSTDTQIESLGVYGAVGNIQLGFMSIPFTIFCIVAGVNAINMIDGIDGLASSLSLSLLSFITLVAYLTGQFNLALFTLTLISTIVAFMLFNFPHPFRKKASVFMGDAGSTFLGFIIVWLLIKATQGSEAMLSPALGAWIFMIPLIDSGSTIIRRLINKESPMAAGRDHHHHWLLNKGLSPAQTCYFLFGLSGLICLSSYFLNVFAVHQGLLVAIFFIILLLDIMLLHSLQGIQKIKTYT
ncbi:MAG: undecaprenyl/decaprenyl-phosphate alpha-N-acetylglucosaminyl 1-phosphate transferase [Pseudomonadales bacterium]|nr:undecaprenyl/decaprenyl-phosphate alpha-N-acetylglucosaminyl 1-phosphate transferase [Pseudomonadales bacterium]